MGGTCLQTWGSKSKQFEKKMFSLKVVLLVVTVVVPYTVARPQDFSNIFGSLNDELTKIVDQTVFQSQSTSPGLRINPSRNQNSGTRYSFGNRPTGGFTVLNGGDSEETQGPGLRSSAPKNPGSGSSSGFSSDLLPNFETPNLRFGAPTGGRGSHFASSEGEIHGSRKPISVSSGVSVSSDD